MEKYNVIVVEYPAKRLVGLKVRSTMQKMDTDIPTLWQTFGLRLSELAASGDCRSDCYGVTVMLNDEEFEYWAAVETEAEGTVPEGMACIDVPAGLYAKCEVADVHKCPDGFMYIYTEWPKNQKEYVPHGENPGFELYPANWQPTNPFEVFAPVRKA